jgi:hypothetical protein
MKLEGYNCRHTHTTNHIMMKTGHESQWRHLPYSMTVFSKKLRIWKNPKSSEEKQKHEKSSGLGMKKQSIFLNTFMVPKFCRDIFVGNPIYLFPFCHSSTSCFSLAKWGGNFSSVLQNADMPRALLAQWAATKAEALDGMEMEPHFGMLSLVECHSKAIHFFFYSFFKFLPNVCWSSHISNIL